MEKANHIEVREKIFSYLEKKGWERNNYCLQKTFYGGYCGEINPLGKRRFHIQERKIRNGYFLEASFGWDCFKCISLEYPTILPGFPETMDVDAIAEAFDRDINKYEQATRRA